jgi:hypothetical protein
VDWEIASSAKAYHDSRSHGKCDILRPGRQNVYMESNKMATSRQGLAA